MSRALVPIALAAAAFAGAAPAVVPGRDGLIAFTRGPSTSSQVWVVRANGESARRVTRNLERALDPVFSAKGTRLAFYGSGEAGSGLYVSDLGGRARLLVADGRHPAWSPSGKLIAFDRGGLVPANRGIWLVRPDGKGLFRAIRGDDVCCADWSPDGRNIVFERSGVLWTAAPNGGRARRLLRGGSPSWSPDGTSIAFARGGDIYSVGATGSGVKRLTSGPAVESEPAWSPSGESMVFDRKRGAVRELWVSDGKGVKRITSGHDDTDATWQPRP